MDTRVYDVADLVVYQDRDGKRFDDYVSLDQPDYRVHCPKELGLKTAAAARFVGSR